MSDFGIMNATQLLYIHIMNAASDDDRRRLHECEERLVSAGLGNYQDLQELGAVTNNIWRGIKDSDESECRRKMFEIDERLRSAGLDDYNSLIAAKINSVAESLIPNKSRITENNNKEQGLPEESNKTEDLGPLREFPEITSKKPQAAKQHVITSRVGILTAINLLYEHEMGIISDYDLRKLGVYEERLKLIDFSNDTSFEVISTFKDLHETIRVEDLQWPPLTLGSVTNNILTKLNKKLASIKDIEEKDLILGLYEKRLQSVGFGDHYDTLEIEELTKDFEDLRRTRGKTYGEGPDEDKSGMADAALRKPPHEVTVEIAPEDSVDLQTENSDDMKKIEDTKLKLGQFGEHCSPIQIEKLRQEQDNLKRTQDEPTEISRETPLAAAAVTSKAPNEMTAELSVKAADTLKEEPSKTSVSHRPILLGPGYVSAAYLVSKLELGEISEDDRRKLGEYEELLKLVGLFNTVQTETAEVPDEAKIMSVQPVPALGDITNNLLKQYHAKYFGTDDLEIRHQILDEYDEYLKLAGFYDHFSTAQFEGFWADLANAVRKVAVKDSSEEIAEASRTSEELSDSPAVVPMDFTSEDLYKLSTIFLKETASKASTEVPTKSTDENVREETKRTDAINVQVETLEQTEDMPRTGFATAMYLLIKIRAGQASDNEITMFKDCEERLKLAGISSDSNFQVDGLEPFPALGKITFNFLLDLTSKLNNKPAPDRETRNNLMFTYINKLKFAGFDRDYSFAENETIWNEIESVISKTYKASMPNESTETSNAGQSGDSRIQVENETSRQMSAETSNHNHIPNKEASGVSDGVINEEKNRLAVSAHINQQTSTAGQKPLGKADETPNQVVKDKKGMAGKKSIEVAEVNPTEETNGYATEAQAIENEETVGDENAAPCVVNENAADVTKEDSNKIADTAWRLVKLDTPTPPVRPCEPHRSEDRSPKDSRVTYVPINTKPERKLVVARRRLQGQAPVDWFSTDPSEPPPGFNGVYTDLYPELPLSCRAYAFSARLKEINRQLYNANEPTAYLLRKEYNCVVDAFDRYLNTLQKRASVAVPTNVQRQRVQPNQEEWRRVIITALFMSKDVHTLPHGLYFAPLKFSQPLTARASAVAERLKMVEVKMANANAQQVLLLSKEFSEILASFDKPYHYPIPGEPFIEPTPRPLPADLEQLRRDKNRALKECSRFPSPENKQIRNELSSEFRRRLAIWKASEESQA